ncbi:MAG: formate dehydrogenase, partial [Pseudomonadota bacterium]|nr:formate dehydrogenase [Pseudomonadota bacterium]
MSSAITVYISRDATSRSLGSDALATALQRQALECNLDLNIVRTGSRGMFWLEPMIEVGTDAGRVAYGPVDRELLPQLIEAGLLAGNETCPGYLGDPETIPFFAEQQRLSFARVGVIDPVNIEDYQSHGGLAGLRNALAQSPQRIVDTVKDSGLRGRGGAAFPTGIKWQTVHDAPANNGHKYIVCNADEGDSGTFADRMLMEGDPLSLIEGMIIAGLAVGASRGYIYLREEYPNAHTILNEAITAAEHANVLGENILN